MERFCESFISVPHAEQTGYRSSHCPSSCNTLALHVGHVHALPGPSCSFLHLRWCDSFISVPLGACRHSCRAHVFIVELHTLQVGYLHSSHRYASRSAWVFGWSL